MSANIGWLFYRDYYEKALSLIGSLEEDKRKQGDYFSGKNRNLFEQPLPAEAVLDTLRLPDGNATFSLIITGAGLLIGTGYAHKTGMMSEIKIGFYFDHTTGVPLLPGSSVKGILRSVFPGRFKTNYQPNRVKFLQHLLTKNNVESVNLFDLAKLLELEAELFDNLRNGEAAPPYERDIFGDAYPSAPISGQFLAPDFITPHNPDDKIKSQIKNPTPLAMLRIRPGVTMTFQFRFTDGILTADQKLKLFKEILLSEGIGAKTNVGFGRLNDPNSKTTETGGYQPADTLSPLPKPEPAAITDPRLAIFNNPTKYQFKNGHYSLIGKAKKGDFVEAVAVKRSLMNPKQTQFAVFVGDQEVQKYATYNFDPKLVGKLFLMCVQDVNSKNIVQDVVVVKELSVPPS